MELSTSLVLLAGAAGVLLSITVQAATHAVTLAHEGSHAVLGYLVGGRVGLMKLNPRGEAETSVEVRWLLGDLAVDLIGYLGPGLFALLGIFLMLSTGDPGIVLWGTIALLAALLLIADFGTAWLKIVLLGAFVYVIARSASEQVQAFAALTWVWWLLVGGVVDAADGLAGHARGGGSGDAEHLQHKTWIPSLIWDLFFLAGTLLLLAVGAGQLLGLIGPEYR